jgi:Transposase DDE domain
VLRSRRCLQGVGTDLHAASAPQRQRQRQSQLSWSEIRTSIVEFPRSHYRDVKHYDTDYVAVPLRPSFPDLVSYTRFVELLPRAWVPLCTYLHTRKGHGTGIPRVDSTPLAVCHPKRLARPKVFDGYATRGQCAMGGMLASSCI